MYYSKKEAGNAAEWAKTCLLAAIMPVHRWSCKCHTKVLPSCVYGVWWLQVVAQVQLIMLVSITCFLLIGYYKKEAAYANQYD